MIRYYLKRILKDLSWVIVLNFVNYSSSFFIAVLITRFLGTFELGTYTFITAIGSLIYLISDFGLTTLLVRKITENKDKTYEQIRSVNAVKIILCTVLLSILAIGIGIKIKNFDTLLFIGCITVLPRLLQTSYEASIRAFLKQKYPTIIRSVNSFIQILGSIILLINGMGLISILLMLMVSEILTAIVFKVSAAKIASRNKPSASLSIESIRRVFKEGSTFFGLNFLVFSMPRGNIILLEYITSTVSVGIFSAGVRFINAIGLFTGALFNTYYPLISNIKEDVKLKYELTKKLVLYASLIGIAGSSFLFLLAGPLINLTFRIPEAKLILKITAFTVLPIIVYTVVQPFFYTIYKEKFLFKLFAIAFVLNFILSIILISMYGYTGCAVVTIVIEYFLVTGQVIKLYNLSEEDLRYTDER